MTDTSGAQRATWSWPSFSTGTQKPESSARQRMNVPGNFEDDAAAGETSKQEQSAQETFDSKPADFQAPPQPHHGPRTCRICLEVVYPTYHMPPEHVPGFLASRKPRVTYESEDPSLGRLLRPCKCKGSSRYVHEGCLDQWRKADPAMGSRNYWQCPTCKFHYRLQRMSIGRWLNSTLTQLALTMTIFFGAVFLLGFVADPIINMYLDPLDTVMYGLESIPLEPEDAYSSWAEHFVKGLASLGLLGFLKTLLAMSFWPRWYMRSSGIMSSGNGRYGSGRDRVASISWIVILMGVVTFLWAVFKGVRAWSRRTLEVASEKVMDVPLDGNEEEDGKDNQ